MNNRYPSGGQNSPGSNSFGQQGQRQSRFFRPDNAGYNDMRQVMQGQHGISLSSGQSSNKEAAPQIISIRQPASAQQRNMSPLRRQSILNSGSPSNNMAPLGRQGFSPQPAARESKIQGMTPMNRLNLNARSSQSQQPAPPQAVNQDSFNLAHSIDRPQNVLQIDRLNESGSRAQSQQTGLRQMTEISHQEHAIHDFSTVGRDKNNPDAGRLNLNIGTSTAQTNQQIPNLRQNSISKPDAVAGIQNPIGPIQDNKAASLMPINEQMKNDFSQALQKFTPSSEPKSPHTPDVKNNEDMISGSQNPESERENAKEKQKSFIEAPVRKSRSEIPKQETVNASPATDNIKEKHFIEAPVRNSESAPKIVNRTDIADYDRLNNGKATDRQDNNQYQIREESGRKYIEPPKRKKQEQRQPHPSIALQITENDPAIERSKNISESEIKRYEEAAKNPHLEKTFRYSVEKIGLINFGALFITPIWAWGNLNALVGIALLIMPILSLHFTEYTKQILIAYILIAIALGFTGNFLAWKYNNKFLSADEFKEKQLKWSIGGIIAFVVILMSYIILIPGHMMKPLLHFLFPTFEFSQFQ